MAKKIIKYQLVEVFSEEENANVLRAPSYVSDGGYFKNGDDLIGVSIEDEGQFSSDQILTKAQLVSYVQATSVTKIVRGEGMPTFEEMSSEEKAAHVDVFLAQVGMSDLE
jgi:hypothetical protein